MFKISSEKRALAYAIHLALEALRLARHLRKLLDFFRKTHFKKATQLAKYKNDAGFMYFQVNII